MAHVGTINVILITFSSKSMWIHLLIVLPQVVATRLTLPIMFWKQNRGEARPKRCRVIPASEGTNMDGERRHEDVCEPIGSRNFSDENSDRNGRIESIDERSD